MALRIGLRLAVGGCMTDGRGIARRFRMGSGICDPLLLVTPSELLQVAFLL